MSLLFATLLSARAARSSPVISPLKLALSFGLFFASLVAGDGGVTSFGPSDPLITFVNTAGTDQVYQIQGNSDNPGTAFGSGTSPLPSFTVPAGQTINFHPGVGFVGAFSAQNGAGTRHEVNFRGSPTWYNADMEFGMSNSTLGPTDGSKRIDGGDSLAGEQDCLAKANAAWSDLDAGTQSSLLDSGFLQGSSGGLSSVSMGQGAPRRVVEFFQMTADFNAYVDAGSVSGQSTDDMGKAADQFSYSVTTNKLTITAY
ncbi:hypothetical protein G7Y79_00043g079370 [Physcia stellaris]|nr:hypothetical protein G7Y79_00043g079370 [Physcia stellaris]